MGLEPIELTGVGNIPVPTQYANTNYYEFSPKTENNLKDAADIGIEASYRGKFLSVGQILGAVGGVAIGIAVMAVGGWVPGLAVLVLATLHGANAGGQAGLLFSSALKSRVAIIKGMNVAEIDQNLDKLAKDHFLKQINENQAKQKAALELPFSAVNLISTKDQTKKNAEALIHIVLSQEEQQILAEKKQAVEEASANYHPDISSSWEDLYRAELELRIAIQQVATKYGIKLTVKD